MERYPLDLPGFSATDPVYQPVVCPYDRAPLGEVEIAGKSALEHALVTARKTQDRTWRRTPAWKRAEILRNVAGSLRKERDELALLIASEGGKPLKDARVEAMRAAVTLEACADAALRLEGEEINMQRAPGTENRLGFTIREPIGVVLAICAFNHPLNLACHQIGTSLAGGNVCLFKPATSTPLSAHRLAKLFSDHGLPDGVLQVIPVPGRGITTIMADSRVNFITFIGSAEVGWGIRRRMANGTRLAAEHGGNAASIVLSDADLDLAIPLVTRGAFYHAGQVCVSTQRLYVERTIEPEFTSRLLDAVRNLVSGDARDEDTDVGPLIEPEEVARVHTWVAEAQETGTELLLGGQPQGSTVYSPTVLRGAPEEARVVAHEVFGPVVVVQPVEALDEAINKINRSTNPFQSSIFTQDVDRAFRAAREIQASAYMINDLTAFRVDWMPFGGRRNAGLGLGGVDHGVRDMTEEKLIVLNLH